MSTIITKYSDYVIQSIEFFINAIKTEIDYRDIAGLTNNTVQKINITKQHPLVALRAAELSQNRNADPLRSGLLPAISITPADENDDKGFTLGNSFQPSLITASDITRYKELLNMTDENIQKEVLITKNQIESILAAYKKGVGTIRAQVTGWYMDENLSVSLWTDHPDVDILFSRILDSVMAGISVGIAGNNSPIRNFKYRVTKGLTNFNYGRVLHGTEYAISFTNTYNNYIIFSDDTISGHDFVGTFVSPANSNF